MALLTKTDTPKADDGKINVDEIISEMIIPKEYRKIYEKFILAGMNFMFNKKSHKYFIQQVSRKQPLSQNIAEGVFTLAQIIVKQTNGKIPPFIVMPAAIVFACKAFEYLQSTRHPNATKETLGVAISETIELMLRASGYSTKDIPMIIDQYMAQVDQGMKDA